MHYSYCIGVWKFTAERPDKAKPLFTEFTEAVSANTDGLCKHRFSPHDDHYLNYNFFYSVSGSSTLWIWDLKLFKVVQFIQYCGKLFRSSNTLVPNTYFLLSSLPSLYISKHWAKLLQSEMERHHINVTTDNSPDAVSVAFISRFCFSAFCCHNRQELMNSYIFFSLKNDLICRWIWNI